MIDGRKYFLNPVMTAAMIDRLTHKSYIVNMNGPSYRVKETQEWLKGQNINIKDLNEPSESILSHDN